MSYVYIIIEDFTSLGSSLAVASFTRPGSSVPQTEMARRGAWEFKLGVWTFGLAYKMGLGFRVLGGCLSSESYA